MAEVQRLRPDPEKDVCLVIKLPIMSLMVFPSVHPSSNPRHSMGLPDTLALGWCYLGVNVGMPVPWSVMAIASN